MTFYDELKAAGCFLASRESDLYVKADATSRPLVKLAAAEKRISKPTLFQSQDPADKGSLFYEIPFAYSPFWRAKGLQG